MKIPNSVPNSWFIDEDLEKYNFYMLVGDGNILLGQTRKKIYYLEKEIKSMESNLKLGCNRLEKVIAYKKQKLNGFLKREKHLKE